jgi:LysR family transcriptional regulator, glycine cleavage system transcriptional activator
MDRLPSLHAVRCFAAAARLKSFTAAAIELHVTQGAISRMVQSLEEELGIPLFDRNGRFISLTAAGQTYHNDVQSALDQIAEARTRVRKSVESDALSIVVNSGFATRWLVPRLPEFQRNHSSIHVNILAGETNDQASSGASQVSIRYGMAPWPGCIATRLPLESRLGVVCSPQLLKANPLRKPQDLAGQNLLTYSGASRDPWQDFFLHFNLPLPDLAQAPRFYQLPILAEAAVSGLGFALVPLFLFENELSSGRLVQALPQTLESERGYYITHPKGAEHDRKVQAFKKWLIAKARASSTKILPA